MNNKKKLLTLTGVFGITALAFGVILATQAPMLKLAQGTDGQWNHYEGVAATLEQPGIREYWVNCNTHEHQFSAPAGVTPTEMGAPSASFIKSLPSNDDRLIDRYLKGIDFEDGVNPYITIKSGFETLSVVDGEGVGGSKALVATRSTAGDSFLKMSKDYLDAVFADPNVKSLSFAARAHNATNNFRHISVDAQYVNNNSNIISCFEINNANWGITTTWKTFYLTRGVYSQMNANDSNLDWFVKFGAGSVLPQYLYIDNIKICTEDYYDYTFNGLENGYWSGTELKDPVINQRSISVASATNQGFDYDVKTEGVRSFTVTKVSGENPFYLSAGMNSLVQAAGDDLYITFDFRGTTALNYTNEGIRDGNRNQLACLKANFAANKWQTITIPKSGVTSDGRFFIIGTSATGQYWIDNIRLNNAQYSFEDQPYTSLFGNYANVSHYAIADSTESDYLRDHAIDYVFIAEWGSWTSIEVVEGISSDGAYSVRLTTTQGGKPIRMMPQWVNIMDDDSVFSFDIYSEDMTFSGVLSSVTPGVWTTLSFTKAEFKTIASYRPFDSGYSAGTMYLDNFRLVL